MKIAVGVSVAKAAFTIVGTKIWILVKEMLVRGLMKKI